MNIDRLIKLLKLANHNPNNEEANSAARAAAKMLGEDNYKWIESVKNGNKSTIGSQASKAWDDVFRSKDPFWRRTEGWSGFGNTYNKEHDKGQRERESEFKKGYYSGVDWGAPPRTEPPPKQEPPRYREPVNWTWTGEESNAKEYKQVLRDCSVCGASRLTAVQEVPYVCGKCKWDKYYKEHGI